jgi:hypothetical protein
MQQLPLFDIPSEVPHPRKLTQSQQLDLLVERTLEQCPPRLHRQLVIALSARVCLEAIAAQLEPHERLQLMEAIAKRLLA